jgi:hypothetical protein
MSFVSGRFCFAPAYSKPPDLRGTSPSGISTKPQ